jgi:hypothetical protein
MAIPPSIHTYHCICASLILASTHLISTLPRRQAPSLDRAFILPVPSQPPSYHLLSPDPETEDAGGREDDVADDVPAAASARGISAVKDLPPEGYSLLLGVARDKKFTIIRREDGFEKRVLYRCSRCRVVVGYEVAGGDTQGFEGTVLYILPNGVMGTDAMAHGKEGKRVDEGDVGTEGGAAVWE